MSGRRRILFVAEAITISHIGRPAVLAGTLDGERYEIHFATRSTPMSELVLAGASFERHSITSIEETTFLRRLRFGRPFWTTGELEAYVEEDSRLLHEVRPDLVIGDLRLSLSVSARLAGIPYAAIANAYWSPYLRQFRMRVPETTLSKPYVPGLTPLGFRVVRPIVFWSYNHALNAIRRNHGLRPFGRSRFAMFEADHTLYAEPPGLYPMHDEIPANHVFVGPATWSPDIPLPSWWDQIDPAEPLVYVSLGSSGQGRALPKILAGLANAHYPVAVSTADHAPSRDVPARTYVTPYLPGDVLARRASVVVSHGGAGHMYQALAEATPVLAIPSGIDQQVSAAAAEGLGASLTIRADRVTPARVAGAVDRLTNEECFRSAAHAARDIFERGPSSLLFPRWVESVLG